MNQLSPSERRRILACLVEGNGIRGTARLCECAKNSVSRLFEDVGDACIQYHSETVNRISAKVIQCDETYSIIRGRDENLSGDKALAGRVWTWIGMDADTRLVICWLIGKRTGIDARRFTQLLAAKVDGPVEIHTDALAAYGPALRRAFGGRLSHGAGGSCLQVRIRVYGDVNLDGVSTARIERQNLTLRTSLRRFMRRSTGLSKNIVSHERALALHFMYYNFCRRHQTLKTTPAIAAGLTDRVWTLHDLVDIGDAMRTRKKRLTRKDDLAA